jgi:hypothetical protein
MITTVSVNMYTHFTVANLKTKLQVCRNSCYYYYDYYCRCAATEP